MPIHDWTRVDAGLFHSFHQRWLSALADALNGGVLPSDFFALQEQRVPGPIPDVLTLKIDVPDGESGNGRGVAVADAPPHATIVRRSDASVYAEKADRITVRNKHGDVVSVIEIVSPGNKASRSELNAFVTKSAEFLAAGVNLLVVDLFPPSRRDPGGIHKAIRDEVVEEDFSLPEGKPLTVVSYDAGSEKVAYIEPVGVGDILPKIPLILTRDIYVHAPLEETYQTSWSNFPHALKRLLEVSR